jgi:hypothetical protein
MKVLRNSTWASSTAGTSAWPFAIHWRTAAPKAAWSSHAWPSASRSCGFARDVLTNSQRVQATRTASRLAEKQLEAEEKKLQVGLATVFTVLDFQEDLAVERSNEINALTEYLKALVRLEEVKGTLLQSYNIVLQADGPRLQ